MRGLRSLRSPIILTAILGLAACAAPPEPAVVSSPAHAARSGVNPMLPPSQKRSEVAGGPSRLKGMNTAQVRALLGNPNFRRRDAPAEIWEYRGHACTLDLFLYDHPTGRTVDAYTVRSARPIAADACLNDLVNMAGKGPGGP